MSEPGGTYAYYPIDSYGGVLRVVQDCEAVCENTATVVLVRPDVQARTMQLLLLRDCADVCTLTAKYIARCSMFARNLAYLCADICEICGNHCLRHPDPESQYCGRVCLNCAKECRFCRNGNDLSRLPRAWRAGFLLPGREER
ncbi:MAG: four-helix bundle copper-binding protein [Peptococcaceae bacterium]|nr:four-helix bundle copper-binding protein [Peptococcaceae bacterium]